MTSNKFKIFLKNLGFSESDFKGEPRTVFVYEFPIDETQSEDVRYIHTPTDEDIFTEHQKLWNQNDVSSFVAVGDYKTYLLDAKVKPDKERPVNSKIKTFDYGVNSTGFEKEKLEEITKDSIDATYFFDFVIKNRKKPQEVDKDLLLNLIALKKDLLEIKDDEETIHLLILRCLFIKYLEDKGIYDEGYLTNALNAQKPTKIIEAFEEIKKINGDIFKFDKQVLETEIDARYLSNTHQFFTSDYLSKQGRLFPYLFDQIPIQLISNVYEAFLNNDKRQGKGIYYTPTFLVNFILSHSLKEKLKESRNVTVFDPAVGSGAFLVESFKAIVKPNDSYEKKKDILQNQLFGVDNDRNALQIAAFSLYLALIETENPEFIREQIEISNPILPSLIGKTLIQKNSITDNVFEDKTFDCIVSNPPWGSVEPNDDEENLKEREAIETKGKEGLMPEYKNVSDYERSQAFLIRVQKWSNEKTIFSLVVKNSIFLNDNSEGFRKELLKTYQINYFYELSNYNKILFKKHKIGEINGEKVEVGATQPCSVLVFEFLKNDNQKLNYISPKLNNFSENFQIIHYTQKDIHEIEQKKLFENDLLWRVLVNGDFEDFELLKNKLLLQNGLIFECRTGFKPKENMKILGDPEMRKWIKPKHFERYLIKEPLAEFNWNQELDRRRSESIFQGNRIVSAVKPEKKHNYKVSAIRTNDNNLVYADDILCYKIQNVENLSFENYSVVLGILNSKLIGYTLFHISSQWGKEGGMKRPKLRNADIERFIKLPLLDFQSEIYQSIRSRVIEIENLKEEYVETENIENQIDEIVFDLYRLKEYEKEIIREFYQIKVERDGISEKYVKKSDIENYANKFTEVFGLMLEANSKLIAKNFFISSNLGATICFTIVNKSEENHLDEDKTISILNFVKRKQIEKADTSKILNEEKVKIYDDKFLYIVKSNLFKDWTVRQAIKDANEEVGLLLSKLPAGR